MNTEVLLKDRTTDELEQSISYYEFRLLEVQKDISSLYKDKVLYGKRMKKTKEQLLEYIDKVEIGRNLMIKKYGKEYGDSPTSKYYDKLFSNTEDLYLEKILKLKEKVKNVPKLIRRKTEYYSFIIDELNKLKDELIRRGEWDTKVRLDWEVN